jgi:MFS family permease
MSRDLKLVFIASFIRSSAISALSVLYGLYLASLGLTAAEIGFLVSSGLLGMALGTLLAARSADRIGRRKSLAILSAVMGVSAILLAFSSETYLLVIASFVGMVNGMGRDRGALQAIDQAVIAQSASQENRTAMFSRYTFVLDIGGAVGALVGGIPASPDAYRTTILFYALAMGAVIPIYHAISSGIEPSTAVVSKAVFSQETRRRVFRFAALSTLDSLGGGFITRSLLTYWFVQRFAVDPFWVGTLFAAAAIVNSVAYFVAAKLAERVGLVNTIVFTHIPSSVLLMLVPIAPTFPVAVVLFITREFFAPMDVPTRQSYLAAIVTEHERSGAAGVVNMARNASWVVGPSLAGWAMTLSLSAPLYIAGTIKIMYDLMMWKSFKNIIPPEENELIKREDSQTR